MLRPHSALHYAWDEPSLPHELLLELPGSRRLGCFALDKVPFLSASLRLFDAAIGTQPRECS